MLTDTASLAGWLHDHDPTIGAASARVDAATAAAQQARVRPNPELDFEVGNFAIGVGNKDPNTGVRGPTGIDRTTHFTVGVSELFEIGKRGHRKAAADLRTSEASESAVGVLGARISDALTTLGNVAYVTARRETVQQNLDAAQKLQALEKVRLDKADLSAADYARIELDTQQLQVQLARANAEVAQATAACSMVLYAPCTLGELDGSALDTGAPITTGTDSVEGSVAQRPDRQAERLESSALGEDAALAAARAKPDPTIGVSYSFDNYNYGGNLPSVAAVTVGIPLPFFDRGKADAAAARANARAIQAESDAQIRLATSRATAMQAQVAALTDVLHTLETDAIPRSSAIIEQTRKSFDLGQADLADLLQVQRAHRDLLNQVLDTRFELFSVRAQLRQELGLDDQAARAATGRKS